MVPAKGARRSKAKRAQNPLLGDVSPRDMIRLGRHDRLRRFIINAMMSKASAN